MRSSKRFGLGVLAVALSAGSLAQASVVVSKQGLMGLDVYARTYPPGPTEQVDRQKDLASFMGAPTSLSVHASAKVDNGLASAFIAVDGKSSWTSPDHGAVDINSVSSYYQLGDDDYTATYGQANGGPWFYSFTPTVDAILVLSVTGDDFYTGRYYVDKDVIFGVNGIQTTHRLDALGGASQSFNLIAGVDYGISVFPWFTDDHRFALGPDDYTRISTRHFTFDITAAPIDPDPDPMSGVPEPATWAMMLAGFGIAGAAMRRRPRGALVRRRNGSA